MAGPSVQARTLGWATRLHHTSSSNPMAHSGWSADSRSSPSRRAFLAAYSGSGLVIQSLARFQLMSIRPGW